MTSTFTRMPPSWFRLLGILFALWGAAGVYAFYLHAAMGPSALAALSGYDRAFHMALPRWFVWIYGLATWGGLLGAVAMLLRRRIAVGLFAVSPLAVAVQFGYVFGATDLIATKGAAATVLFPLVIFGIALWQLTVARQGAARGWLR